MNAFEALRRLEAWKEGRPLPRGETLHFPLAADEDVLVVAFVRMGGESAPWGIAWGTPGEEPKIRSVPEPRNRDLVAEMCAGFAPELLAHLFHPASGGIRVLDPDQPRPLRQVWLPNASHADMLHHLAYAYTFARKGVPERVPLLNALGRAAGWLFREYNRPGQVTVMAGTEALRESFTFPCEDVRQGHLGYLLAWLGTRGGRDKKLAAAGKAEERSVSTSLTPALERDELADRLDAYGEALRENRTATVRRLAKEIADLLEPELRHRFDLTVEALARLRGDGRRTNRGVDSLVRDAWRAQWWDYLRTEEALAHEPGEKVFVPSPETDRHPGHAAGNYFVQQAHEEKRLASLLEDDVELQAEAIAAGEAAYGTIRTVRDLGTGRTTRPFWEIEVDGEAPTKLRKNRDVLVARTGGSGGQIREVLIQDGKTVFLFEITRRLTIPIVNAAGRPVPPADRKLEGTPVVLLPATAEGLQLMKRKKLREKDAPGAWLTDSTPRIGRGRIPAEVAGPVEAPADGDGE